MDLSKLAELLVKNGLKYAFGITGGGKSLTLIAELELRGVEYFNVSHESSSVIMAGAACKYEKNSAISLSIRGPGLTNSIGGISYNFFENIPSISISEAYGIEDDPNRMHKRINHELLVEPFVEQIINLNINESDLDKILNNQKTSTKPLHIELSNKSKVYKNKEIKLSNQKYGLHIKEFEKIFFETQKPLLIIGSTFKDKEFILDIKNLKIPKLTTASARGILDESEPYSAGIFTGDGKSLSIESNIINKADLIIAIGLRSSEITGKLKSDSPIIFFDNQEHLPISFETSNNTYFSGVNLDDLFKLTKYLKNKKWGASELKFLKEEIQMYLCKEKWLPANCFKYINNLDYPFSLILDTGNFCTIAEHSIMIKKNRFLCASNNGRFMGGAIPSSIGISLARQGVPSFCILGDGGIQTYPSDFKIIKNFNLPICFLFIKDGYYSSVRGGGECDISINAVKINQPSWINFLSSCDFKTYECNEIEAFIKIINRWNKNSPIFIQCNFDERLYRNMTTKLR